MTGCPTISYELGKPYINQTVESGDLWKLILFFDKEGYLLTASTPGEEEEVHS